MKLNFIASERKWKYSFFSMRILEKNASHFSNSKEHSSREDHATPHVRPKMRFFNDLFKTMGVHHITCFFFQIRSSTFRDEVHQSLIILNQYFIFVPTLGHHERMRYVFFSFAVCAWCIERNQKKDASNESRNDVSDTLTDLTFFTMTFPTPLFSKRTLKHMTIPILSGITVYDVCDSRNFLVIIWSSRKSSGLYANWPKIGEN